MVNKNCNVVHPERVAELSKAIGVALNRDIATLKGINSKTRMLSINARIEAAHADGSVGAAFSVIANEIMQLSSTMDLSYHSLQQQTAPLLDELEILGIHLVRDVRGQRLADLAASHLDLVDRNLYERSCDVRWWATDNGLVSALQNNSANDIQYASKRMGTILDSYTVYFDLVLCNADGVVVANGRPSLYHSVGLNMKNEEWFKCGLSTTSGIQFGFQSVHVSQLVPNERILVYSTAVRKDGLETGEVIGVIGVVFRWDALGQLIVDNVALTSEEKTRTRVMFLDKSGRELAASSGVNPVENHPVEEWLARDKADRFYFETQIRGQKKQIAIARSMGYETYKTGWLSVIIQNIA